MAHDVFVSYANQDKGTADAVVATLEQQQIRCWIAPRDVPAGQEFAQALVQAVNGSRVLVLVFSSGANSSPHVMREVSRAADRGIPILPLRIEDVPFSETMEYYISTTHWLDALTRPVEQHLEQLARSVKALLGIEVDDSEADRPLRQPTLPTTSSGGGQLPPARPMGVSMEWARRPIVLLAAGAAVVAIVVVIAIVAVMSGGGDDGPALVAANPSPTTIQNEAPLSTDLVPSSIQGEIAFVSAGSGNEEIWIMNADGTDPEQISSNLGSAQDLSWSRDGSQIAFSSNQDGNVDIYVINIDGTGLLRLTSEPAPDDSPAWFPSGRISFGTGRDGPWEIYDMERDGTDMRNYTQWSGVDRYSSWSVNGAHAFQSDRFGEVSQIIVIGGGEEPRPLITDIVPMGLLDGRSSWSPDGSYIAFESFRETQGGRAPGLNIFVASSDGLSLTRITNGGKSTDPAWRP